jgi:hypothetical protein
MGNNTLKLSQACEGMLRYKAATGKKSTHDCRLSQQLQKTATLTSEPRILEITTRLPHIGRKAIWGGVHTKRLGKAVLPFYNCTSP